MMSKSTMKSDLLGAHLSIAGGMEKAIDRALAVGCTAMQIFVKNNMQWFARPLADADARKFREHPRRAELGAVFGHTGYLINLAATNPENHKRSVRSLTEELVRADQLDVPFLVLHPGAHLGAGEEAGLEQIVKSIDGIYRRNNRLKARIALEITAGQGTCLGHKFEHLAFIIENVKEPERICACLDTAHLFAAGYDLSTDAGTRKTFRQFDKIVGRKQLVALHLNDSKTDLGSRVDRHDHIGKGKIGLEAFRYIMNAARFSKIPKVLETPKGKECREDVRNMRVLRGLHI
jgi:deoxyribonuclease-4